MVFWPISPPKLQIAATWNDTAQLANRVELPVCLVREDKMAVLLTSSEWNGSKWNGSAIGVNIFCFGSVVELHLHHVQYITPIGAWNWTGDFTSWSTLTEHPINVYPKSHGCHWSKYWPREIKMFVMKKSKFKTGISLVGWINLRLGPRTEALCT